MGDKGSYKNPRNQDLLDTHGGKHTTVDQQTTMPIQLDIRQPKELCRL